MSTCWKTRTATLLTALTLGCASAPATVKPPATASSSAAATAAAPPTAPSTAMTGVTIGTAAKAIESKGPVMPTMSAPVALEIKKPIGISTGTLGAYDRVALIWGFPSCAVRPWIVSVVDLGARVVTTRALASSSELELYVPSPMGEACIKGACPTMSVVMPPQPPSLFSGSGTMIGGGGKGRYAVGTSCPEPPMVTDADLYDWALRMVTARNDAQAAIAALRAAGR